MWSLCDSLHAIAIYALDTNWKATTTVLQSRWKVWKSQGAISNTSFFDGTSFVSNSAKIWEGRLPFLPPRFRRPCTVVFASDFLLPPPVAVAENSNIVHEDEARNAIASCTIVVLVLPKGIPNILSSQATTSGWQRNSCFVRSSTNKKFGSNFLTAKQGKGT